MKKLREINIFLEAETDTSWRQFSKTTETTYQKFFKILLTQGFFSYIRFQFSSFFLAFSTCAVNIKV